jgi:hypothetical protein
LASLNPKIDSGWDVLLGLSLVGALVAAYFAFVPAKPRASTTAVSQKSLKDAERAHRLCVTQAGKATSEVKRRTWDANPEGLGARMMEKLNAIAETHRVQLANFQAGRPVESAALVQTPFVVTLQGSFSDVMRTIRSIENPDSRIAVSAIKLEPAKTVGSAANTVSTTLNLTAFLYKEKD